MSYFQLIEKRMSDEEGDFKFHSKKDDAIGEKNKCCGSTHGFTRQSDGTLKCISCGKTMKPVKLESCGNPDCKCTPETCKCKKGKKCGCKKNKFESYEVEMLIEKLGSVDAIDASELGIPANTPITFDMIKSGFKKLFVKNNKKDPDGYTAKIKAVFKGATPEEIAQIRKLLDSAIIDIKK